MGTLARVERLHLLTGEAGTGKTTLIYSLLQRDFKQVRIAYIVDPKLSFLEILRVVMDQLNLYCKGSTKLDYLEALDRFLKLRRKEERVAIIVDESQDLSDDGLEELRLLSNHGQRNDRCLQLILVGQPELVERLKKPELRQLNQRISTRGVLKPLNIEQAMKYVDCRLRAQGGECAAIFERRALKRLLLHSAGIPRKINVLCQNAMLLAYSKGAKKIDLKTAMITACEYDDALLIPSQIRTADLRERPMLLGGFIVGAALALGSSSFVYLNRLSDSAAQQGVSSDQATEVTVRPEEEIKQAHMEARADSSATPPIAPLASHPVEYQTSLAPEAIDRQIPKGAVAEPVTAQEVRAVSAPSRVVALRAMTQEQTRVSPLEQRRKIIVRYGDTLEKLAIRYLRSKTGINDLIDANPQLTNINRLSIGQILHLPSGGISEPRTTINR